MKVSDYIVEYLIQKNVTDIFGYPGGMVTHLMDSLSKYTQQISSHVTYHEQGAAFAACGYAQESGKVGVAYATSGPGATNLITGICNAYFDSIPTIFLTGQVNTFERKNDYSMRQRGFQETDIVEMVRPVTKYAVTIERADEIKYVLDYAFYIVQCGRKGPVLIDIPMDISRAEIVLENLKGFIEEEHSEKKENCKNDRNEKIIREMLSKAKRPVFLIGNGIKISGCERLFNQIVEKMSIPVVSTMLAVDVVRNENLNYGFVGAYGNRSANFVVAKSDLIISLGARLDVRQVGAKRENFAPESELLRIDVDESELAYKVHANEVQICADVLDICNILNKITNEQQNMYQPWLNVCNEIKEKTECRDERLPNTLIRRIGERLPTNAIVTTDVGQNQVWVAQSLKTVMSKILFSGGHGAMGYSLPAAIGAAISSRKPVYCFNGDGGIQMNLQELQTVVREQLPVKIILFNNYSLGMIRHFQEMYFDNNYFQTTKCGQYTVPNFGAIASAYGIRYFSVSNEPELQKLDDSIFLDGLPAFIEVMIKEDTYVFPKLEFGKPNQDQEPLLERELYDYLMKL